MNDPKKPSKLDRAVARAAAADTARIRADLDGLAARAELAGMPRPFATAVRHVHVLMTTLGWSPAKLNAFRDDLAGAIAAAEENRDAAKARD